MNKRGQIFLVAAVIIVVIVAGLGVIYNYVKAPKEDKSVYDLSKELDYESAQIIDNGIFNSRTTEDTAKNLENLSTVYAGANPLSDIIIIYGNTTEVNILKYNNSNAGEISITTGGSEVSLAVTTIRILTKGSVSPVNEKVTVSLRGIDKEFNLRQGENFYIILKKDKDDERVVASNK